MATCYLWYAKGRTTLKFSLHRKYFPLCVCSVFRANANPYNPVQSFTCNLLCNQLPDCTRRLQQELQLDLAFLDHRPPLGNRSVLVDLDAFLRWLVP